MKYFPIAAHNRELVVIDNMETFAHYYCYTIKQKQGQVPDNQTVETHESLERINPAPAYEIEEAPEPEDDDL